MPEKEKNIKERRIWPWLLIPLVLLLLAVSLRIAVRSDWAMEIVRNQAINLANEQLNGWLTIGKVEGDLLFGLQITDVELFDTTDFQVLKADSIKVGYSVLRLLREPHEINDILIYGMEVDVRQQQDESWNLQTLMIESGEEETPSRPLSWTVHNLSLKNSHINAEADFFPEGQLDINNLNVGVTDLGYEQEWSGVLRQLQFSIPDTLLSPSLASTDAPAVDVNASASVNDDQISLNHLAISSGLSFLEAHATLEQLSRIEGGVTVNPLSWRDLTAFSDIPIQQNVEIALEIRGTLPDLYLGLEASAPGLERLFLETSVSFEEPYSLDWVNLSVDSFNGPLFTGNREIPSITSFTAEAVGNIPFNNPSATQMSGSFASSVIGTETHRIDRSDGSFELENGRLDFGTELFHADQRLAFSITGDELFSDLPLWSLHAEGDEINPADWLSDPALDSNLTFSIDAAGEGLQLSDRPIDVVASVTDSRIGTVSSATVSFDGMLSETDLRGELQGSLKESRLFADFTVSDWQKEPFYEFTAAAEGVNLEEITELSGFPTWLNAEIAGTGSGISLEELVLNATVRADSSVVNEDRIEQFTATLNVQNEIVTISDTGLESTMMDGTLSGRQHLNRPADPENRLDVDFTVKSLTSLAPLFEVGNLQGHGKVTGSMIRTQDGLQQFSSVIDLEELEYDTLYSAEKIYGNVDLLLRDTPLITADLDISGAAYDSLTINTLEIQTESALYDSLMEGTLQVTLIQDSETSVTHSGRYRYSDGDIFLQTNVLDISTPLRTLSLQEPFELEYRDEHLEMSRLWIFSDDENASLELTIPWLDENRQEIQLVAERLNLGTLQRSLLDDVHVEALLSGRLNLMRNDREIRADSELLLTEIVLNETSMDSMITSISIRDDRMEIAGSAWNLNQEIYSIEAGLPFEPVDPMALREEFFDRPVSGTVHVNQVNGSYLSSLMNYTGDNRIEGVVLFHGEIGGTAGDPVFTGNLRIRESMISDVSVDSLNINITYNHENEAVELEGFIESLNTQVARFNATIPLYVDLRRFTVDLPDESDDFYLNLVTDSFNLSLLNTFIEGELAERLSGTINGDLEITGPFSSPQPSGYFTLREGRIHIVPADITLNQVQFDIRFNQDRIDLESLSMRSHQGSWTANGYVELEELTPGRMNINMEADQFRLANRPDLNAVIDLDGTLAGTLTQPEINGSVSFRNGYVYLQNFGEDSVEDVSLEDEGESAGVAVYDSMAITMDVSFNEQFYIRNRQYLDLEVELEGLVDLVKEPGGELEMFGSLQGASGYARPLGRLFELETAQVIFYGPIANPELNIRTLYRPPQSREDISIWYVVEGTVDNPDFSFESQPHLELQDIISYTVFGQPFYTLDSWAQVVSAEGNSTSITDVTLDLLLDRVETLATRQLGIDVVRIDNSRTGSGSTTSIQTGWYLNNRTFFAISNEISTTPQTLFILEYMLRENLELVLSQGGDNREGIDLRWTLDY